MIRREVLPMVLVHLLAAVLVVLAVVATGCHAPHMCPRPTPRAAVARCWR